ncbi:heme oxygenase (decycling) 1 [Lunasporangiospora selenospora]|uniref:Heme oxygenase (Decycling) 1 n=1 Tax=Lunasporangiospora selenospora TaxID=979761 RepID=A0A9P6G388_9FUNG|nr:heme oxygenase (decycling) 1 [Lunasporangiospora selenospora]
MPTKKTSQSDSLPSSLTVELRQKTKGLHLKLDRLVQLGLFTILDYQVCKPTLSFVKRTFEEEYERHVKSKDCHCHPWVAHTYAPHLRRTEAFEADLDYFYGPDWKDQPQTRPTKRDHIRDISKRQPIKLVAFPATLYLGIFFGGQITRSKIVKSTNFSPSPPNKKLGGEDDSGIAIFTFRERLEVDSATEQNQTEKDVSSSSSVSRPKGKKLDPNKVKNALREQLNTIPNIDDGSESTLKGRAEVGQEAQEIFARNLDLMTSVRGMSWVWVRWIVKFFLYFVLAVAVLFWLKSYK